MTTLIAAAADAALSLQFMGNSPLESVTLYAFFATTIAMGAGAAFFTLMLFRGDLDPEQYTVVALSALICGIACVNYQQMTGVYQATGGGFPTGLRYIDWLLTTPLLLLTFPLLLGLGWDSIKVFLQLVLLDLAMILLGFVGEISPVGSQNWWLFFALSCGCGGMILLTLFFSLQEAIHDAPEELAKSLQTLRLFILIGWAVYPLGFLLALSGDATPRELIYNVADVINKVGFGLVVHAGVITSVGGSSWGRR